MCRRTSIAMAVVGSLLTAGLALAETAKIAAPSLSNTAPRGGVAANVEKQQVVPAGQVEALLEGVALAPADKDRLTRSIMSGQIDMPNVRNLVDKSKQLKVGQRATSGMQTMSRDDAPASIADPSGRTTRRLDPGAGVGPVTPSGLGEGNCCASNGTPGCNDPACEAAICAADPFCCNTAWDGICANAALATCAVCMGIGPDNDLCADAEPVAVGSSVNGTTIAATAETVPTCGGYHFAAGVWYSVVGTGNQITVDTCTGGSYDSILTVLCGDCNELFCAGWNDDAGCGFAGFFSSSVTFCSTPGRTYLVYVDGFFATGNFTLTVTDGPPCNNAPLCMPCVVNQPPGSTLENEPNCGLPLDFVNGGCNGTVVVPAPGNCGTPHAGVGCTDPACQAAVCAVDSFCCVFGWDAICAAEAQAICGVVTEAGTPISCGETVYGSGAWDPTIGFRDTDWYTFTLTEPASVTWTVTAEFQGLIAIIDGGNGALDCTTAAIDTFGFTQECVETSITSGPLLPGSYWAFVAPLFADAVPCAREYAATLTCDPLCDPAGCAPCDLFALLQPLVPAGQQTVDATHPCFGHPAPSVASDSLCCDSIRGVLPMLPGVVAGDHARLDETHPCWVP